MKKEKEIKIILKNIYNLLDWKQNARSGKMERL